MTKLIVLLAILVTGIGYSYSAVDQGVGSLTNPGAGFFPVVIGVMIVAISAVLLIQHLPKFKLHRQAGKGDGTEYIRPLLYVLGGVAVYVLLLPIVHYPVATLLLCAFLMWVCGMRRWIHVGGYSTLISLALYFAFTYLQVSLP